MKRAAIISLAGFCLTFWVGASTASASSARAMKKGIKAYEQGKHQEALTHFTEAQVESPDDPRIGFDKSSAQYKTGNYKEAARGFEGVVAAAKDRTLKEKALYNLGNTAYRQGNLQGAAGFYRRALVLDPADTEAKQNLEFVLKKVREQKKREKEGEQREHPPQGGKQESPPGQRRKQGKEQEQQSGKGSEEKGKGGQKQEENPSRTGQEQSRGEQKKPENLGENKFREAKPEGEGKEQGRAGQASPAGAQARRAMAISPEEAERLLNSLSDDQRSFIRRQAARSAPKAVPHNGKDW